MEHPKERHCIHCNATEDVSNGIVLGSRDNRTECNICLSDWLYAETLLSRRESDVVALETLRPSWTREQIGEILGIKKSTVDSTSQRASEKMRKCETLVSTELRSP